MPKTTRRHQPPSGFGRDFNIRWKVNARHALYDKNGTWYNHLLRFPGALFDPRGYVLFQTEGEYRKSPYLQHGQKLHVHGGISSMPGYIQVEKPDQVVRL